MVLARGGQNNQKLLAPGFVSGMEPRPADRQTVDGPLSCALIFVKTASWATRGPCMWAFGSECTNRTQMTISDWQM
eukprot:11204045-Lingulodinium_polyedra.AAC.1